MVDALAATGTSESRTELTAIVEEFVTRLTGQPTMQQMYALVDEIEKRGRPRPDATVYFQRYMDMPFNSHAKAQRRKGGKWFVIRCFFSLRLCPSA